MWVPRDRTNLRLWVYLRVGPCPSTTWGTMWTMKPRESVSVSLLHVFGNRQSPGWISDEWFAWFWEVWFWATIVEAVRQLCCEIEIRQCKRRGRSLPWGCRARQLWCWRIRWYHFHGWWMANIQCSRMDACEMTLPSGCVRKPQFTVGVSAGKRLWNKSLPVKGHQPLPPPARGWGLKTYPQGSHCV